MAEAASHAGAMALERLDVSRRLIDLIEKRYPGTLTRVRDGYDWTTANGYVVRLSVGVAAECPSPTD